VDEFYTSFKPFYDMFHVDDEHPFVISSTCASYNYEIDGVTPKPGAAKDKEADIKVDWLTQLTSKNTSESFPDLIAVVWCVPGAFSRQMFPLLMPSFLNLQTIGTNNVLWRVIWWWNIAH
jgi:hypothetical protein